MRPQRTSYPHGLSDLYLADVYPEDLRRQEAPKLRQRESPSFVSFVASDRDYCQCEMRGLAIRARLSGVSSKCEHRHMQVAPD